MARLTQEDIDNFINLSIDEIKPKERLHEDCFYIDQYTDISNNPFRNLSLLELKEKELEISFENPEIFNDYDIEKLKNEINQLKDIKGPFIQLSAEKIKAKKFDADEYLTHLETTFLIIKEEQKMIKCFNCMKETNVVGDVPYWFCNECLDK